MSLTKHMSLFYCGNTVSTIARMTVNKAGSDVSHPSWGLNSVSILFFVGKLHKSGKEQGSNANDVLRSLVQTLQAAR